MGLAPRVRRLGHSGGIAAGIGAEVCLSAAGQEPDRKGQHEHSAHQQAHPRSRNWLIVGLMFFTFSKGGLGIAAATCAPACAWGGGLGHAVVCKAALPALAPETLRGARLGPVRHNARCAPSPPAGEHCRNLLSTQLDQ